MHKEFPCGEIDGQKIHAFVCSAAAISRCKVTYMSATTISSKYPAYAIATCLRLSKRSSLSVGMIGLAFVELSYKTCGGEERCFNFKTFELEKMYLMGLYIHQDTLKVLFTYLEGKVSRYRAKARHTSAPPSTDTPPSFPALNSSTICSIVTHSTPSCPFNHSMNRSCSNMTCGFPDTCGWMLIGNTKLPSSGHSRYRYSNCSFHRRSMVPVST
jgi:hypothetical protein